MVFENEAELRENRLEKSVSVVSLPADGRWQIKPDNAQLDPVFKLTSKLWTSVRDVGKTLGSTAGNFTPTSCGGKWGNGETNYERVACHKLKRLDIFTSGTERIVLSIANSHGTAMDMSKRGLSNTPHMSQMNILGVRSCPIDWWGKT